MNTVMILGLLRDLLKITGGSMLFSDSELSTVIGALMTLATVGWSIYERVQKAKEK